MVSALDSGSNGPGSSPGGVEILLVTSCYRNRDKLHPDGPLGSYADFTYLPGFLPIYGMLLFADIYV